MGFWFFSPEAQVSRIVDCLLGCQESWSLSRVGPGMQPPVGQGLPLVSLSSFLPVTYLSHRRAGEHMNHSRRTDSTKRRYCPKPWVPGRIKPNRPHSRWEQSSVKVGHTPEHEQLSPESQLSLQAIQSYFNQSGGPEQRKINNITAWLRLPSYTNLLSIVLNPSLLKPKVHVSPQMNPSDTEPLG